MWNSNMLSWVLLNLVNNATTTQSQIAYQGRDAMQNCETIVKFSTLEVWEFMGYLDTFWDTSDWCKIKILVVFLSVKY